MSLTSPRLIASFMVLSLAALTIVSCSQQNSPTAPSSAACRSRCSRCSCGGARAERNPRRQATELRPRCRDAEAIHHAAAASVRSRSSSCYAEARSRWAAATQAM